jgi:hypothetical protein
MILNHNRDVPAGEVPHRDLETLSRSAQVYATVVARALGNIGAAYSFGHPDAVAYREPVHEQTAPTPVAPSVEVVEQTVGMTGADLERQALEAAQLEGDQPHDLGAQDRNPELAASARTNLAQVFDGMGQSDV